MPKAKKPNPRNAARGTRPTMYRLSPEVLAMMDRLADHLSRSDGLPRSRADVLRVAVARLFADEFRKNPDSKSP